MGNITKRAFVFFWETEPSKFIFELAGERKGDIGKDLTADEICRKRLREGNKKTFNWQTKEIYPIDITEWIEKFNFPKQTKDKLKWTENSILRKQLVAEGFPVLADEGTEKHKGDMFYAIKKIKKYLFGTPTAEDMKPRPETGQRLLDWISKKHQYRFIKAVEVLYGVTMGAGKTADFMRACQFLKMLTGINVHGFVTPMPNTMKDVCRDARNGIQFQDIMIWVTDRLVPEYQYLLGDRIRPFSEIDTIKNLPEYNHIIAIGVQDARGQQGKKYVKILKKFKFGLWGKDEAHTNQSAWSKFAKNVESYVKRWLDIYMTGTPEQFVLEYSQFTEDNSILFLANDLYREQIKGNKHWQGFPWRNLMINDFEESQQIVASKMGLEDKHLVTLRKLWKWDIDNHCLVNEAGIDELIKIRFGNGAYRTDPRCFWGPGSGLAKIKRKVGIVCIEQGYSNKKTQYVATKIEQITGIKAFSAHEKNGYDKWLNYCNHENGDCVYITHDKDMTGKNNPHLNWGWMSLNISSVIRANQGLGRWIRKWLFKTDIYVYFDNPDTALAVTLDIEEAISSVAGSTKKIAEEIFKIASYWFEKKEKWRKADIPDLVNLINKLDPHGSRGLESSRHIDPMAKCPKHLEKFLKNVHNSRKIKKSLSNIKASKGKDRIYEKNDDKKMSIKDLDRLYRANLKASLRRFAKAVIYSNGDIVDIDSILENKVIGHGDINMVMEKICDTEIPFRYLKEAFDKGVISKYSVNKALDKVRARYENE